MKRRKTRFFVFPGKKRIVRSAFIGARKSDEVSIREIAEEGGLDSSFLARHRARIKHTHRRINCAVIEVESTAEAELRRALRKQGHQTAPVKPVYALLHESVPMMDVPAAWESGLTGKGVAVGIVDSGIDDSHPDFEGRLLGYKDFTGTGLKDRVGHGTHVAGIIAGAGAYYRGVAPGAKLLAAKVLDRQGTTDDIVLAGISWAAYSGAQVINLSLGGPGDPDDVLSRECDALMKEGIVVCVAAGNSGPRRGTISSPGMARLAITVGAVDKFKEIAFYSSRGPVLDPKTRKSFVKPDLLACGGGYADVRGCDYRAGIVSAKSAATPPGECSVVVKPEAIRMNYEKGNMKGKPLYEKMSGTSMAAPHVSGIAALLLERISKKESQGARRHSSMGTRIKEILIAACGTLGLPATTQGAGVLSAAKAIAVRGKVPLRRPQRSLAGNAR